MRRKLAGFFEKKTLELTHKKKLEKKKIGLSPYKKHRASPRIVRGKGPASHKNHFVSKLSAKTM
jgi:hypothetical protein